MKKRQINFEKQIYGKVSYPTVVDTEFTELVSVEEVEDFELPMSNEEFFEEYDNLFYSLPKKGAFNSHESLVKRSSEYLGVTSDAPQTKALLEEINDLRIRLLQAQQEIVNLSSNV